MNANKFPMAVTTAVGQDTHLGSLPAASIGRLVTGGGAITVEMPQIIEGPGPSNAPADFGPHWARWTRTTKDAAIELWLTLGALRFNYIIVAFQTYYYDGNFDRSAYKYVVMRRDNPYLFRGPYIYAMAPFSTSLVYPYIDIDNVAPVRIAREQVTQDLLASVTDAIANRMLMPFFARVANACFDQLPMYTWPGEEVPRMDDHPERVATGQTRYMTACIYHTEGQTSFHVHIPEAAVPLCLMRSWFNEGPDNRHIQAANPDVAANTFPISNFVPIDGISTVVLQVDKSMYSDNHLFRLPGSSKISSGDQSHSWLSRMVPCACFTVVVNHTNRVSIKGHKQLDKEERANLDPDAGLWKRNWRKQAGQNVQQRYVDPPTYHSHEYIIKCRRILPGTPAWETFMTANVFATTLIAGDTWTYKENESRVSRRPGKTARTESDAESDMSSVSAAAPAVDATTDAPQTRILRHLNVKEPRTPVDVLMDQVYHAAVQVAVNNGVPLTLLHNKAISITPMDCAWSVKIDTHYCPQARMEHTHCKLFFIMTRKPDFPILFSCRHSGCSSKGGLWGKLNVRGKPPMNLIWSSFSDADVASRWPQRDMIIVVSSQPRAPPQGSIAEVMRQPAPELAFTVVPRIQGVTTEWNQTWIAATRTRVGQNPETRELEYTSRPELSRLKSASSTLLLRRPDAPHVSDSELYERVFGDEESPTENLATVYNNVAAERTLLKHQQGGIGGNSVHPDSSRSDAGQRRPYQLEQRQDDHTPTAKQRAMSMPSWDTQLTLRRLRRAGSQEVVYKPASSWTDSLTAPRLSPAIRVDDDSDGDDSSSAPPQWQQGYAIRELRRQQTELVNEWLDQFGCLTGTGKRILADFIFRYHLPDCGLHDVSVEHFTEQDDGVNDAYAQELFEQLRVMLPLLTHDQMNRVYEDIEPRFYMMQDALPPTADQMRDIRQRMNDVFEDEHGNPLPEIFNGTQLLHIIFAECRNVSEIAHILGVPNPTASGHGGV